MSEAENISMPSAHFLSVSIKFIHPETQTNLICELFSPRRTYSVLRITTCKSKEKKNTNVSNNFLLRFPKDWGTNFVSGAAAPAHK
jgi:hypothetical protein